MPALELKGRMASLTRLRLLNPDLAAVRAHLEDLARRMPDAVRGLPVVIEADFVPDLGALRELLSAVGMQPVGVSEGPLADPARALGFAVLPEARPVGAPPDRSTRGQASGATPAPKATAAARKPANHQYPAYEGMIEFRKAVSRWYDSRFGVKLDHFGDADTRLANL